MANDRIYIKCDTCGACQMLMKFFPGHLGPRDMGRLGEWLEVHGRCHPNLYQTDLGGVVGFSLYTEEGVE